MKVETGIHDLPTELFTAVLEHSVLVVEGGGPWVEDPVFVRALTLARVCRKWRNVVLNTPTLWATFSGDLNPSLINYALDHSTSVPLLLFILLTRRDVDYRSAIARLFAEINRVALLDLRIAEMSSKSPRKYLCNEAPLLERLRVQYGRTPVPVILPLTLFGGVRPPKLRHLHLSMCQVPWDSPLLNNLTILVLELRKDQDQDFISYPQLQEVLCATESLEVLALSGCLPDQIPPNIVDDAVVLPHLQRLTLLNDNIDAYTAFLRLVNCTPTSLRVRSEALDSDYTPFFEACARRLRPPPGTTQSIDTLKIADDSYTGDIQLEGFVTNGELLRSAFNIIIGMNYRSPLVILEPAMGLLPVNEVRTMHLYAKSVILEECMSPLYDNLPELRTIDVATDKTTPFLVRAFTRALGKEAPPVPFPKLERVQVPPQWLPDVQPIINAREAVGVPVVILQRDSDNAPPNNLDDYDVSPDTAAYWQ